MDLKPQRLLIVDDEEGILDFLARCFEREGFAVATAPGGWEAIKTLEATPFDAVISDLRMPHGDGVELLERVAELPAPRPVVAVMTAFADMQPADLFGRGAAAFFEKPLDIDDMIARVAELLRPVSERWASAVGGTAPAQKLELSFESDFAAADRCGEVRFGRGGLFAALRAGSPVPRPNAELLFSLKFAAKDGKLAQEITGWARVAWTRPVARHGFHAGLGLEIRRLEPASLAFVLRALESSPQAFIPLGLKPATVT